jgi:hypothetical protein
MFPIQHQSSQGANALLSHPNVLEACTHHFHSFLQCIYTLYAWQYYQHTIAFHMYIYIYIYIYIKRNVYGDTIANYECNKLLLTIPE